MFKNRNLLVVSAVAIVNALGYGIIIPILYSYSQKYGLSDFENGLLFSIFSICQFISTPVIGRLSDKFGRKPLLTISITGTAVSFFMAAFAPSAIFLFIARALDGLTAGNLPVATAVISDTTTLKNRARGFGIINASFGFGFVFGPAISAATAGFGLQIPFIIAGIITTIAVLMTIFILQETNKFTGKVQKGKLFDFPKLMHTLTDKNIGLTMLVTLIYSFAFGMLIYAYQPFTVKVLNLTPNIISVTFMIFGIMGLISQLILLPRLAKLVGDKRSLELALVATAGTLLAMGLVKNFAVFVGIVIALGLVNSLIMPFITTILSKETDEASQGSIMGLNSAYVSIGTIFGPIVGGALATLSTRLPFAAGSLFVALCFLLSLGVLKRGVPKEKAF